MGGWKKSRDGLGKLLPFGLGAAAFLAFSAGASAEMSEIDAFQRAINSQSKKDALAFIDDGIARPGPLGISIDSDPATCRVLDATGVAAPPVWAIGALRRGVLWDTLAIPEIREQAADIARQLLAMRTATAPS